MGYCEGWCVGGGGEGGWGCYTVFGKVCGAVYESVCGVLGLAMCRIVGQCEVVYCGNLCKRFVNPCLLGVVAVLG